jgi:Fur family transcriptional regulator, ferric uptake regulator
MSHQNLDYARLMHERGFRVTPQRQLILDAICEGGGHAAPDEVYARVRRRSPAVNRATIYRNLDFLCDMHLITSTDVGLGGKVYEIACEAPHHHLVCRQCGGVIQIDHTLAKAFFAKIEHTYAFTVETDHLALWGVCPKCRAK